MAGLFKASGLRLGSKAPAAFIVSISFALVIQPSPSSSTSSPCPAKDIPPMILDSFFPSSASSPSEIEMGLSFVACRDTSFVAPVSAFASSGRVWASSNPRTCGTSCTACPISLSAAALVACVLLPRPLQVLVDVLPHRVHHSHDCRSAGFLSSSLPSYGTVSSLCQGREFRLSLLLPSFTFLLEADLFP